jgi:hypothetical protein
MTIKSIEQDFIEKVSEMVRVIPDGKDRFRVFTPFMLDDGDHISIVLKKEQTGWVLSDEGHTFMHLTYDIKESKLFSGTRYQIISNALDTFNVEDRYGELIIKVQEARFGDALYSFAQALVRMGDVLCLSTEHVQSTFMDDFHSLLNEHVPVSRIDPNWHSKELDSQKKYTVDCRINGMPDPLFVYALSNDDRIRDATIALQKFLSWDIKFSPMGIFKDREDTNSKVRARFDDVCEVQFPNMKESENEIIAYIAERI